VIIGGYMIFSSGGTQIRTIDDWFKLAPPKRGNFHWKDGRSAKECARAWCPDTGDVCCPSELTELLNSHPDIKGATIVSAIPEYLTSFDRLGEPRNSDMVAIAHHCGGNLAISIEAKADEAFDESVMKVLHRAVRRICLDMDSNGVLRVQQLAKSLLPPRSGGLVTLGDIRYQLLTAVAGALSYAKDVNASRAVFLVHEFKTDSTNDQKHFSNQVDLNKFVARLTGGMISELKSGVLEGPILVPGAPLFPQPIPLYLGKASRDLRNT
jgi:hypothetical protein